MAANMSSQLWISESSAPNTFNSLKSFESKNELAFQALLLGSETWTIWHLVRNAIQRPADPVLPRLIILLKNGDFWMASSKTQEREQAELPTGHQPISGKLGATIIGPTNPSREAENPDTLVPPRVDHGTMANLRWSFADSHMHLSEGGWGRQTTARELPIATEVAGVNMRLTPGGVREMHWHKAAEWAYMLKGRARITAIDQDGRTFQDDVGEGDL